MTSGEFHSYPISSISIDRSSRNRREISPDSISTLSDSIRRIGLIHPIVITREGALVAGETRLEAARALGWSAIPCQFTDELDESALRAIELEENIKRSALDWQDECRAIREYHDINKAQPGWTLEKTAEALGLTSRHISNYLGVADALAKSDPRVLAAPKFSTAKGIVARTGERARADEAAMLSGPPALPQTESILNVDFNSWAPAYAGPPFNLLHCDFPYGINIDKMSAGAATVTRDIHGAYDDSPETYWALCNSLVLHKTRLLGTSAHIIFWFSMQHYSATFDLLSRHFYVDPYPLIWHKSDNKGTYVGYERRARRVYEAAFFCSAGDRKIISQVSNLVSAPTVRDLHATAKPIDVLAHFFRVVVDGNTRMLDPTCGSGTSLCAAESLGASHVLGLELNPDFAATARGQLAAHRNSKKAASA